MSLYLICIATILAAISGFPGFLFPRSSNSGQKIACVVICFSAVLGLSGVVLALYRDTVWSLKFPWPVMGDSVIGIDALSAFFLVPVFVIGALGSMYGLGYWVQSRHPSNSRKLVLFWGLLVSGMILLVISRHALAFLLGWEVMALAAFFLVTTEDNRAESRWAGWVYLISTHIGTLSLLALFSLWKWKTGTYNLLPLSGNSVSFGLLNLFFLLSVLGFGLKAGVMPLHFWLPAAHSTAPSHISAIFSGVVLKMGIYGLVRWLSLFPDPPLIWGNTVILLGLISGLAGVLFAIGQHDLKRLLAYHSIENIGIILMGLGIALLGRSSGKPVLVVLGMAGCLLHVWNHCFFKSLLFFGAGAVVHNTHTRQIDRLGGLAGQMPWTAALFLVGAIAICGLPPLNGFISELFVYLGFFNIVTTDSGGLAVAASIPVLAAIGALACACFVKVYGAVFLGSPRTITSPSYDPPSAMLAPMIILAVACALIGAVPMLFSGTLMRAIAVWSPSVKLTTHSPVSVAPLLQISILSAILIAAVIITAFFIVFRKKTVAGTGTWNCGYATPAGSMQYTASSFADSIVLLFKWMLRPQEHKPRLKEYFPKPEKMSSHIDEIVLDRLLVPAGGLLERCSVWFHRFQQGLMQHYILYILVTLFLMLCMQMPVREIIGQWLR